MKVIHQLIVKERNLIVKVIVRTGETLTVATLITTIDLVAINLRIGQRLSVRHYKRPGLLSEWSAYMSNPRHPQRLGLPA